MTDAHKGLQVYAYGFANNVQLSCNHSYDPSNETLKFLDNLQFDVDKFITDFPPTASETIRLQFHERNLAAILLLLAAWTVLPMNNTVHLMNNKLISIWTVELKFQLKIHSIYQWIQSKLLITFDLIFRSNLTTFHISHFKCLYICSNNAHNHNAIKDKIQNPENKRPGLRFKFSKYFLNMLERLDFDLENLISLFLSNLSFRN